MRLLKEKISLSSEDETNPEEKQVFYVDDETNEEYSIDGLELLEQVPVSFDSLEELEEYAERLYKTLEYYGSLKEFSSVGGIVGYNAPLGSNPASSKEIDVYAGHRSKKDAKKKVDSDEKIRNDLATTDKKNYVKKHPIMNIRSKP
jgi:hypothetical protein